MHQSKSSQNSFAKGWNGKVTGTSVRHRSSQLTSWSQPGSLMKNQNQNNSEQCMQKHITERRSLHKRANTPVPLALIFTQTQHCAAFKQALKNFSKGPGVSTLCALWKGAQMTFPLSSCIVFPNAHTPTTLAQRGRTPCTEHCKHKALVFLS